MSRFHRHPNLSLGLAIGLMALLVGIFVLENSGQAPSRLSASAASAAVFNDSPAETEEADFCWEDFDRELTELYALLDAPPAVESPPAPPRRTLTVKRRDPRSEEELRADLNQAPELKLDATKDRPATAAIKKLVEPKDRSGPPPEKHFTLNLLAARADLAGLPLRQAHECELTPEAAKALNELSFDLRAIVGESRDIDPDPTVAAAALERNFQVGRRLDPNERPFHERALSPAAVPALMQMLTAEPAPVRLVLVRQLARIDDRGAAIALARVAQFDLSPEVRQAAIEALAERNAADYRSVLLEGVRYPWAPVADHAAEALVALGDRAALPELERFLNQPDPAAPLEDADGKRLVREVVKVNHLGNCLMCHAPVDPQGIIVAPVPDPYKPLPPTRVYYRNRGSGDILVRAEITYLKQDFSVMQPVANAHPWPQQQRFDYVVRQRPLTAEEAANHKAAGDSYPQREAVKWAIQELQQRVPEADAAAPARRASAQQAADDHRPAAPDCARVFQPIVY